MQISFNGQSVLVAGAARGLGRGIVDAFVQCGAHVFAADRLADELEGVNAHASVIDLNDDAAVRGWISKAESLTGRTADILVYVAGGVVGQSAKPMENITRSDWNAIVDANLSGAFFTSQAVVPGMKAKGKGRIVFITSVAGIRTSLTGIQAYASAKAGEIGLARQLAQELGPFGITVNTVAPGFQRTSPDYIRQWNSYTPEKQAAVMALTARGRAGTPQDIANAVLFFASDMADFVTGQTLIVSGSP